MALLKVEAIVECDGCGRRFPVEMDNGPFSFDGMYEEVTDTIRGTIGPSVQADMHLCTWCTQVVDDAYDHDNPLTREEVMEALDEAVGV